MFASQAEQSSSAEPLFLLWISPYDHLWKFTKTLQGMEVCQTLKDYRGAEGSLSLRIREILPHRGQNDNLEISKGDHADRKSVV